MLITNIEDFIRYIPTANGTEWPSIAPFLEQAETQLVELLLGQDLYLYLATHQNSLRNIAARLLSLQAYENAIPFVDLVQTPNGFAVISGGNLVPASKERVEKLRTWVSNQIDLNTDLLLQQLVKSTEAFSEWRKFYDFNELTNCLFLTGLDYSHYVKITGSNRTKFLLDKHKLLTYQVNVLEKVISSVYMAEIITAIRTNVFTGAMENVIRFCKMILGKLIEGDQVEAQKLCNALANVLDSNLALYTHYAASAEYALKIKPGYENKLEDPTFFFN